MGMPGIAQRVLSDITRVRFSALLLHPASGSAKGTALGTALKWGAGVSLPLLPNTPRPLSPGESSSNRLLCLWKCKMQRKGEVPSLSKWGFKDHCKVGEGSDNPSQATKCEVWFYMHGVLTQGIDAQTFSFVLTFSCHGFLLSPGCK